MADFGNRNVISYSHHKKQASNLRKTGGQDKMEKFIYWIKRTLHHSKQCNSLCMLCKYYDECKIDGLV